MKHIRPAIVMIVAMTVITGIIYPLLMTGIAQAVFPYQANGSLIEKDGKVIGSALIGQNFTSPTSTSTAGRRRRRSLIRRTPTKTVPAPYAADNSAGSNLGPTSKALVDRVKDDAATLAKENPSTPIPADLVTTSASGLDPDITPAGALFQVPRVAKARGLAGGQGAAAGGGPRHRPPAGHHRRAACQRAEAQPRAGRDERVEL